MSRELRTGIATVCLSGTLDDKLAAAASAGFDGVEIFEPDLVASPLPPGEVRLRCADLGLSIDLYQPFRDLDSTDPDRFAANLRRAERKFDLMEELGADTVLVCSSVADDAVADLDRLAEQLHTLGERAGARGLRIAYEALAWGKEVSTYDRSWEAVRRADHPALGLCLDSFHILSRGSDPAAIADIPGDKLFFLQLADAPHLSMDVLQWSRHHRLFPGQGAFFLPASSPPCSPPDTPGRCRSRCSTTSSAKPIPSAPRSTRTGPCWRWPKRPRLQTPSLSPRRKSAARRSSNSPPTLPWPRCCPRSVSRAPASTAPNPWNAGNKARRGSSSTAPAARRPSPLSPSNPPTPRPPRAGPSGSMRSACPGNAAPPKRTSPRSPHRTGPRCSSAAPETKTTGPAIS
ncbi:conserved hypothetical protein [Streptomyces sp. AA4]|nr:conserved hypothetical protein [Streptomyces sp. AA4]